MKKIIAMAGFASLLLACEPKPDSAKLLDQLVVSTSYDTQANFGSYTTYSISTDTIGFYSNASSDTIITQNTSDFPRPVLQAIETNMNNRGYTKVSRKANPDLGLSVSVVNDFNVFQQTVYPGGYGGYGGGAGYGGGYYYPSYYGYGSYYSPYVNTYTSNTGVLIVELIDLKNIFNNKVKSIWTANMGDIYSTLHLIPEAQDAINQSFTQSPYLTK